MKVPITKVEFDEAEVQAVAAVLRSGWIMQGPQVEAFEKAVAAYVGTREAVATSSGTAALHLALVALGVGPGDEVVVPSLIFIASANVVLYCGATPIFVDVDPDTYNIDAAHVKGALTARTKAIVPVDQLGLPADMGPILELAAERGVTVVEDAACALGATYRGARIGSLAPVSCFSFHPRKIITTGEGGMLTTDDLALAARLRALRSHGATRSTFDREKGGGTEIFADLGFNYRMTDVQAALGVEQMKKLEALVLRRRTLAARYATAFAGIRGLRTPSVPAECTHIYQSYMVRVTGDAPRSRDDVLAALHAVGVGAKGSVQAIHREALYEGRFGKISLPATELVAREGLILPLFPSMADAEQEHVIEAVQAALAPNQRAR